MLTFTLSTYAFLVIINLVTFGAFGLDKHRARTEASRLPTISLLGLAMSGGWLGAKLGQRVFRHKSRKQPFRVMLNAIPLFHAAMATGAVVTLIPLAG